MLVQRGCVDKHEGQPLTSYKLQVATDQTRAGGRLSVGPTGSDPDCAVS